MIKNLIISCSLILLFGCVSPIDEQPCLNSFNRSSPYFSSCINDLRTKRDQQSTQQELQIIKDKCSNYGFTFGTDAFAQCVMNRALPQSSGSSSGGSSGFTYCNTSGYGANRTTICF